MVVIQNCLDCLAAELTPEQNRALAGIISGDHSQLWPELTSAQFTRLEQKADAWLAECQESHVRNGLVVCLRFSDTHRTELVALADVDRSVALTGFYLAALGYRYAVRKEEAGLQ